MGLSLFIAKHLNDSKQVEKIFFYTPDPAYRATGKNLNQLKGWEKLELVKDYASVLNTIDKKNLIVFIDDIGMGFLGDWLRKNGFLVVGGSSLTDKLEDEREFTANVMSKIMDVPESTDFKAFDEGIKFVKSQPKEERFIFKPNDVTVPKEYTYVSKDVEDLVNAMERFKGEWKWKEDFQIQRFVDGIEVDFSGYFNGKEFIENSMMIYFENKPFMNNDVGPATGGSIAVEFARGTTNIFWEILKKTEPILKKANYQGQFSLNSIVSKEDHKPYFLEVCGRVGYPSLPMDISILESSGHKLHELFLAITHGINAKELFPINNIGCVLSIFVPPAPTIEHVDALMGEPIDWDEKYDNQFFPYYIMYDESLKKKVLTGCSPWIMNIVSVDKSLDRAVSVLYNEYRPSLRVKQAEYRTDLGVSAKERINKLKEWGLIK